MRTSRRIATSSVVALAVASFALASCGGEASSDPGVVRPKIRLPVIHEGDLLAAGRVTAYVRVAHRGRVRLTVTLRRAGLRSVELGTPRRVTLAPSHWRPVQVLLSRKGRAALAACPRGQVVAAVHMPWLAPKAAVRSLRLDPPDCGRFFSRRAFWNTPLPRSAPIDPDSARVVNELLRRVQNGIAHGPPPSINTNAYTPPVYTVGASQPRVPVHLDRPPGSAPALEAAFRRLPLPAYARPASGGDAELVLWQPETDTMWEFFHLRRAADGWHANWGGRLRHVMAGPGTYPDPRLSWGTSATGLPLPGGLLLPHELSAGRINHVLALGVPANRAGFYALPAQRSDGASACSHAPVEGSTFRLDPRLDLRSLHLAAPVYAIARAAQQYGIVVREQAGAVVFYAQNASTFSRDPYPAMFGGRSAAELIASFPWSRLQLVRMKLVKFNNQRPVVPDLSGLLGRCG